MSKIFEISALNKCYLTARNEQYHPAILGEFINFLAE
jgi:hypothetical protein